MSWDVVVADLPEGVDPLTITEPITTLGLRPEIIARIRSIFPEVEMDDSGEGYFQGRDFVLEFNLGEEEVVTDITLSIRGGDEAFGVLKHLCAQTGWIAVDLSTNRLIDFTSPDADASYREWQALRGGLADSLEDGEE